MSTNSNSLRRILVPMDDSLPAEWARLVACQMAEQLGAQVLLLHVVHIEPPIVEGYGAWQRTEASLRQKGEELLERAHALFPAGLDVDTWLREGAPAAEIVAAAKSWKANLIVMGSHGRGWMGRLVLGSVANAVIREAPCPVVTVPHEPRLASSPEQSCCKANSSKSERECSACAAAGSEG